jgi:cadmium resistance protein CadD (predicted permease)
MSASLLVTAVVAFLGTTIDDVIVLTALFVARGRDGLPSARSIVGGQYLGFGAVLVLALLAAAGLRIVPDRWVGLLGLVPIAFGGWGLWRLRGRDEERPPLAGTVGRVAMIAFANGADNISVFTPLFRGLRLAGSLVAIGLFLAFIGVWCGLGALLGSRHGLVVALGRIGHWLVPVVFIGVGVLILITSGTLGWPVR